MLAELPAATLAKVHAVGIRLAGAAGRCWSARSAAVLLAVTTAAGLIGGCSSAPHPAARATPATASPRASSVEMSPRPSTPAPVNVYAHIGAGMMNPKWAGDPYRVYVPNSLSDTVKIGRAHV